MHEMMATDAGSGSNRRRGRVCRATLATALCVRAIDARTPKRQTCHVSVCRPRFRGRTSDRRSARLTGWQWTRLSIVFANGAYWTASVAATYAGLGCDVHVCRCDRRWTRLRHTRLSLRQTLDSVATYTSVAWARE
jgi:hypothetical protein